MATVRIVALKPVRYGDTTAEPGQALLMEQHEAHRLVLSGEAVMYADWNPNVLERQARREVRIVSSSNQMVATTKRAKGTQKRGNKRNNKAK